MTVIRNNSISGINSITAQSNSLNFYDTSGNTLSIGASVTGGVTVATGATISGSTNTITASTNGSERVRVTSTGNIGIGTDNPTVFGTAYRTLQLNPAAGTGDGSAIRFMYDGGTANTNDLVIYTNSSQSYIRANGARNLDIMRNGSTVATFNANGIALPSGLGIDFSATSDAGGMTSELLDDYEEGTWTPIDGSGSGLTFSNTSGNCFYTKIGRMVYASFRVTYPSTSSTAIAEIGGLPFTSVTTTVGAQACAVAEHSHSVGTTMIVNGNATTMYILTCSSGVIVNTNANVSGKDFRGTAIYHAAV